MILNKNLTSSKKFILRGTDLYDGGSWQESYEVEPDLIAVNPATLEVLLGSTAVVNPFMYLFDYNGFVYNRSWAIIIKSNNRLYFSKIGAIESVNQLLAILVELHKIFKTNKFEVIINNHKYLYDYGDFNSLSELKNKIIILNSGEMIKNWTRDSFKSFITGLSLRLSKLDPTAVVKKGYEERRKIIPSVFDEYKLEWYTFPCPVSFDYDKNAIYPQLSPLHRFYETTRFWGFYDFADILLHTATTLGTPLKYNEEYSVFDKQLSESIQRKLMAILIRWKLNRTTDNIKSIYNDMKNAFYTPIIIDHDSRSKFKGLKNWWDIMASIEFNRLKNI